MNEIDFDQLEIIPQPEIIEFTNKIDFSDTVRIMNFGAPAMERIRNYSNSLVHITKTSKDISVNSLLAKLLSEIKLFDSKVVSNIWFKLFPGKRLQMIKENYHDTLQKIGKIEESLKIQERNLLRNLEQYRNHLNNIATTYRELSLYIACIKHAESTDQLEKKLFQLETAKTTLKNIAMQYMVLQNQEADLYHHIVLPVMQAVVTWKISSNVVLGMKLQKELLEHKSEHAEMIEEYIKKITAKIAASSNNPDMISCVNEDFMNTVQNLIKDEN